MSEDDLHAFLRGLDSNADGLLTLDEWAAGFPLLAESEPATHEALATLSLKPKQVRELFEGATAKKKEFAPVPPDRLAKFKFKLHAHKAYTQIFTSKRTDLREQLTLWEPDVDDRSKLLSAKKARFKVCLGHYAVGGSESPARGLRTAPMVLEVTDTSITMGLSASEHLAAVVEQLLPPPLRYRLAWHSEEHELWVWRAVPPGAAFLALGMVATRSEEPPPPHAMCCVPRRWCVRDAERPRAIWKDSGGAGRPGSIWATGIQLQLMLAVLGHDPPPADLAWRLGTDRWYAVPERLRDLIETAGPRARPAEPSPPLLRALAGPPHRWTRARAWSAGGGRLARLRRPPPLPTAGSRRRSSSCRRASRRRAPCRRRSRRATTLGAPPRAAAARCRSRCRRAGCSRSPPRRTSRRRYRRVRCRRRRSCRRLPPRRARPPRLPPLLTLAGCLRISRR